MQFLMDCAYLETKNSPRFRGCPRLCGKMRMCVHDRRHKQAHPHTHTHPSTVHIFLYFQIQCKIVLHTKNVGLIYHRGTLCSDFMWRCPMACIHFKSINLSGNLSCVKKCGSSYHDEKVEFFAKFCFAGLEIQRESENRFSQ